MTRLVSRCLISVRLGFGGTLLASLLGACDTNPTTPTTPEVIGRVEIQASGTPRGIAIIKGATITATVRVLDTLGHLVIPQPAVLFASTNEQAFTITSSGLLTAQNEGFGWLRAQVQTVSGYRPDSVLVTIFVFANPTR